MKKRKVFVFIFIGLALGLFIIQPLAISLHMYDMQGDNGSNCYLDCWALPCRLCLWSGKEYFN